MPSGAQIILVLAAALVLIAGGVLSASRLKWRAGWLLAGARAAMLGGIALTLGALLWHAVTRGDWLPITDNFDALLWLAMLLSLFVLYVQRTDLRDRLGGVDWFIMPLVVLLLVAAAWFGTHDYHRYHPLVRDLWAWAHRVSAYAGAAAFAVAAAAGGVYVLMSRQLRQKTPIRPSTPRLGSLEKMERLTTLAVRLGFALLTIALITGLVKMIGDGRHITSAKLALSCGAWAVYAVVLHAPLNPVIRGRRAAVLSILGFVLILGTVVAVQLAGGGR